MELNDMIDVLFSWNSPVIFATTVMLILIVLSVLVRKEVVLPLQKRVKKLEKENELLRKELGKY
jgi:hypothetical protein